MGCTVESAKLAAQVFPTGVGVYRDTTLGYYQ